MVAATVVAGTTVVTAADEGVAVVGVVATRIGDGRGVVVVIVGGESNGADGEHTDHTDGADGSDRRPSSGGAHRRRRASGWCSVSQGGARLTGEGVEFLGALGIRVGHVIAPGSAMSTVRARARSDFTVPSGALTMEAISATERSPA